MLLISQEASPIVTTPQLSNCNCQISSTRNPSISDTASTLLKVLPFCKFNMSPSLLNSGYLILSLAVLLANYGIDAWSATATSSFGGRMLSSTIQNGARMEMKKGKANVPPQMRGQYKKQQEMAKMQRQVMEASRPGADGLPVFNLYVRTKKQNVRQGDSCCPLILECLHFHSSDHRSVLTFSFFPLFRFGILAEASKETNDRQPWPSRTQRVECCLESPKNN